MAGLPSSNPQSQVDASIEQQQLNNFLGPIKGALGGLPVAEKNQEYFIVFQQAGGTGPEIIDETAYFITYLVDSKGNVSKPSEDYNSLYNTIQNFEVGKNAIVRNDASTILNTILTGKKKITAIGRQEPILYSQTGSSAGANIDTINFNSLLDDDDIPNFLFWMFRGETWLSAGSNTINNYGINLSPDSPFAILDASAGEYQVSPLTGPASNINRVDLEISTELKAFGDEGAVSGQIQLQRKLGTEPPSSFATISSIPFSVPRSPVASQDKIEVTLTYPLFSSPIDNLGNFDFRIVITTISPLTPIRANYVNFRASFQSPSATPPAASIPFLLNNNGTNLWITASSEISANYGNTQNSQNVLDVVEPGFNFSPIEIPLVVQPGDRIRFGYSKEQEYVIYEVIEPNQDSEGKLKLRLNTLVPSTINLDNFVIHRVNINDPAYIILDVKKDASVGDTQNFNGIILPEYPTQELKDNLENILLNLKEKGIITDNEK